jgi:hypothetical protein
MYIKKFQKTSFDVFKTHYKTFKPSLDEIKNFKAENLRSVDGLREFIARDSNTLFQLPSNNESRAAFYREMISNSNFRPGTFGRLINLVSSENSSFSPFVKFRNLDRTSSSLGEYSAEMAEIHEAYLSSPAAKRLELRAELFKITAKRLELKTELLNAAKDALAREEYLTRMFETSAEFQMRTEFQTVQHIEEVRMLKNAFPDLYSGVQGLGHGIQSGVAEMPLVVESVVAFLGNVS